jgi:hypothetical protein
VLRSRCRFVYRINTDPLNEQTWRHFAWTSTVAGARLPSGINGCCAVLVSAREDVVFSSCYSFWSYVCLIYDLFISRSAGEASQTLQHWMQIICWPESVIQSQSIVPLGVNVRLTIHSQPGSGLKQSASLLEGHMLQCCTKWHCWYWLHLERNPQVGTRSEKSEETG